MDWSTPGLPIHHQLPEFTQTHFHWVGDAIQPSHPLLSPSPPAFNLSQHQGLFKWVSSSHQVTKVLEFQIQHQSFNEYPGLISFRMDWLDLLAVQGTLKSLLQHHSSKASNLWHSAFFIEYQESICLLDVGTLIGFILSPWELGRKNQHGSPRSHGKRIPTTELFIYPFTHLFSISLFILLINPRLTCNCERCSFSSCKFPSQEWSKSDHY